jgi:Domain of unknown function DUF29
LRNEANHAIPAAEVQLQQRSRTASPHALYDEDFALWIEEQVAALRAGDVSGLDTENLIEELEGLTKRDQRALGSQLKRIMAHLLKQRHQPGRASRSWEDSIQDGREEVADILEQSPSLRKTLPDLMRKNYPRAVAQAARDTRLPLERFPERPPFDLAECWASGPSVSAKRAAWQRVLRMTVAGMPLPDRFYCTALTAS